MDPIDNATLAEWKNSMQYIQRYPLLSHSPSVNCHDSKPLLTLLDKAGIKSGTRIHADKAYYSQKHRDALKSRGIKNGIQDKAAKNNPLTHRQLQRNSLITKARYVIERTFGSQACWFNAKSYVTAAK